jgi:hypothetical protein
MKKLIIVVALIISAFSLFSQVLNDYIIKLNDDTIKCNIDYVDNNSIFYNYYNSKLKYRNSNIQLLYVKSYNIKYKTKSVLPLSNKTTHYPPITKFMSFGVGRGLNYGGIGGCITGAYEYGEMFLGAGYNGIETGCNIGLLLRVLPAGKLCPYLGAMYGYNAAIKMERMYKNITDPSTKTYYGPSFCLGFEVFTKKRNKYFNFTFILPVKSKKFEDDLYKLKHDPNIILKHEPSHVLLSVGFHFL